MKIIAILILAILVGCANKPQPTQAMQINSQMQNILQRMKDEVNTCIVKNNETNDAKVVIQTIIFDNINSPYKIDLLTNKQMIDDSQKESLSAYLKMNNECRNIVLKALSSYSYLSPILQNQQEFNSKLDAIYVRLINKEINISDANKFKEDLVLQNNKDRDYAWKQIQSNLDFMHNQENSNRIAEQQRQTQILQNYMIMQNANRPITTNCTAYGNTANCTTR